MQSFSVKVPWICRISQMFWDTSQVSFLPAVKQSRKRSLAFFLDDFDKNSFDFRTEGEGKSAKICPKRLFLLPPERKLERDLPWIWGTLKRSQKYHLENGEQLQVHFAVVKVSIFSIYSAPRILKLLQILETFCKCISSFLICIGSLKGKNEAVNFN